MKADETVLIASEEWANQTNRDGSGIYWDLIKKVFANAGYQVKIRIRSYQGSVELLKRQKVDAVVGLYAGEQENVFYPVNHFDCEVIQALYLKSKFSGEIKQKSLQNKKVCWIKGYNIGEYLNVNVRSREISSREDALSLVFNRKVDFFLDAKIDLTFLLKSLKMTERLKLKRTDLSRENLYICFVFNNKGKKLAEIFDKQFSRIKESGELKTLYQKYEKYGITYPFEN